MEIFSKIPLYEGIRQTGSVVDPSKRHDSATVVTHGVVTSHKILRCGSTIGKL